MPNKLILSSFSKQSFYRTCPILQKILQLQLPSLVNVSVPISAWGLGFLENKNENHFLADACIFDYRNRDPNTKWMCLRSLIWKLEISSLPTSWAMLRVGVEGMHRNAHILIYKARSLSGNDYLTCLTTDVCSGCFVCSRFHSNWQML